MHFPGPVTAHVARCRIDIRPGSRVSVGSKQHRPGLTLNPRIAGVQFIRPSFRNSAECTQFEFCTFRYAWTRLASLSNSQFRSTAIQLVGAPPNISKCSAGQQQLACLLSCHHEVLPCCCGMTITVDFFVGTAQGEPLRRSAATARMIAFRIKRASRLLAAKIKQRVNSYHLLPDKIPCTAKA
jgi:hypothetical protein